MRIGDGNESESMGVSMGVGNLTAAALRIIPNEWLRELAEAVALINNQLIGNYCAKSPKNIKL